MKHILVDVLWLKEQGACNTADFERVFPKGAKLIRRNLLEAGKAGLNLEWFARCGILSATAWKAYNEALAPARKAYNEALATAWKAYDEALATALADALGL